MLIARFDGGCVRNPGGHASCACLIERDGTEIFRQSKYLGFGPQMSNNVAEYEGVKMILKWYLDSGLQEQMTVVGDSQVVIFRMLGKYRKPVTGLCAGVAIECLLMKQLIDQIARGFVAFEWSQRSDNSECDAMCSLEIETAQHEVRGR